MSTKKHKSFVSALPELPVLGEENVILNILKEVIVHSFLFSCM
jgi:hypothetical protein